MPLPELEDAHRPGAAVARRRSPAGCSATSSPSPSFVSASAYSPLTREPDRRPARARAPDGARRRASHASSTVAPAGSSRATSRMPRRARCIANSRTRTRMRHRRRAPAPTRSRAARRRSTARRRGSCPPRSPRRRCTAARSPTPSTGSGPSGPPPRTRSAGTRGRRQPQPHEQRPRPDERGERPRRRPPARPRSPSQTTNSTHLQRDDHEHSRRDTRTSGASGSFGVTRYQWPRIIAANTPPVAAARTRAGPAAAPPRADRRPTRAPRDQHDARPATSPATAGTAARGRGERHHGRRRRSPMNTSERDPARLVERRVRRRPASRAERAGKPVSDR